MTQRYFVEPPIQSNVQLSGAEAHHLLHVMRAAVGQNVTVFDGSGFEFTARIDQTSRSTVDLVVLDKQWVDRELPIAVTLAVALPKGDRQKWLVEKAVELGVKTIVPLTTQRGVAQPTGKAIQRLERSVIEASKQCGRNQLMEIESARTLGDYVTGATADTRWIAHPTGAPLAEALNPSAKSPSVIVCIGPEGGFSEDEVAVATQHDWQAVSFGSRILRIETAALSAAVIASGLAPTPSSSEVDKL